MKKFHKGQMVRLAPLGLKAHIKSRGKVYKSRMLLWQGRTGIIGEINSMGARVRWNGNKSLADVLSLTALEPVESLDGGRDHNSDIDGNVCCDGCPYRNSSL